MRINGPLVRLERYAAYGVEQLRPREHATRLARERREELELGRREVDGAVGSCDSHPRYV